MITIGSLATNILFCASCGGDAAGPSMSSVERDSAGITIVENSMDTALAREGWVIDPSPNLVIGGLDAPVDQQLFQVRGGGLLPDNRIVVMDGGSAELRIYNADGSLAARHGRKGEGPGEFTQPRLAGRTVDDTLVVYDRQLRRVSHLHADEGFVRSYQVGDEGGGFPIAIGVTETGGLAVGGGMYFSSQEGFKGGVQRPNSRYVILSPDGSIRGDFGEVPAAEMFGLVGEGSFSVFGLPFGKSTVAAVTPDRFWLGTGDSWEIKVYTLDAKLSRIVRFDRDPAPVTGDLRDAALLERLENADNEAAERTIRRQFEDMPLPDLIPPYQIMMIDALDHAWIGEYLVPGATNRTYTVVDSEGHAAGRVTFPPHTAPLEIGPDYVLGLTRDELDIEYVTLWRLTRP